MPRNRLNLQVLRDSVRARLRAGASGEPRDSNARDQRTVSRRQIFHTAGAAALAFGLWPRAAAAERSLPAPMPAGPFTVTCGSHWIAFSLDGQERWRIDARRFGGSPSLHFSRRAELIEVRLRGAFYPGTDLSADLTATIQPVGQTWRMRLRLHAAGVDSDVPFESWLRGAEPLRAAASVSTPVTHSGAGPRIQIAGPVQITFQPNWDLRFQGAGAVNLTGLGGATTSDALRIALLDGDAPGLMLAPEAIRSLIAIRNPANPWPDWTVLRTLAGGRLTWERNPFDAILLEAAEHPGGRRTRALLATAAADTGGLRFDPGAGWSNPDGSRFDLSLHGPRLAMAFDPAGDQTALFAEYSSTPAWVHGDGVSLLLGQAPETPTFEAVASPGQPEQLVLRPRLHAFHAPMAGAVVQPSPLPPGTTFDFAPLMGRAGSAVPAGGEIKGAGVRNPVVIRIIPINFSVAVLRPRDLLSLRFSFINLSLETTGDAGPRMVRNDPAEPAYMIVHFPPQNITERSYFETEDPEGGDTQFMAVPTASRLAGPSRLAFQVPDSIESIPYTIEGLLDWTDLPQSVASTAKPRPDLIRFAPIDIGVISSDPDDDAAGPSSDEPEIGLAEDIGPIVVLEITPQIEEPANYETAIEAPWQLILSPNRHAGWAHALGLVTHDDRTELWHTRLGVRRNNAPVDEQSTYQRALRAIWTPGYFRDAPPNPTREGPFPMSPTPRDRYEFVRLTSDYTIPDFTPQPVQADRFMLSALGAWIDTRGVWTPPNGGQALSREEWRHIGTMGRDQYVRVVEKGYLFPFGHRASLVKITERKCQRVRSGPLAGAVAAFLRTRKFIVVREPEKRYPIPGQAKNGRKMPFKRINIVTQTTPTLDPEVFIAGTAFWPRVSGQDFLFHLVGEDSDGQRSDFTAPLVFAPVDVDGSTGASMDLLIDDYDTGDSTRRDRPLSGQKVAFAESSDEKPGNTTLETVQITFQGEPPDPENPNVPFDQPLFFPAVREAAVRLPAVEQLTGRPAPAKIKLHDVYLDHAFSDNPNQSTIFAELIDTVAAALDPDKAGGVISPNMAVNALPRQLGPVGGDVASMIANGFDPEAFFQGAQAKILGAINLHDIIKADGLDEIGGSGKKVPKITNRVIYPIVDGKEDSTQLPEAVETLFVWEPDVQSFPPSNSLFVVDQGQNPTALSLNARAYTKFNSLEESEFIVVGSLTDFRIDLVAPVVTFLQLEFNRLGFTSRNGEKPDIQVDIENVTFAGPLTFVNVLDDYLKFNSPGPAIDVTASGITALYTLGLPNIAVGVFALQNISLSAGLNIPFSGAPVMARFAFCTREDPFLLTVSMFGGGGFFGIALSPTGVEILEASLEFGGSLAFDIGVASGGVYITAGIYFKMQGEEVELTGYLELGGAVSVLGLITLTIEFYLGLTYQSAGNKVRGQATLTVQIEVLFFSQPITMTVERQFAGSGADPTFEQLVPTQENWDDYAGAFAA